MEFCENLIKWHTARPEYAMAEAADRYFKHDSDINRFVRFLYNHLGGKVKDIWSPNNKIGTNLHFYFTVQIVQFILGNGITFGKEDTKDKLGDDFEKQIDGALTDALNGGASYLYWNMNHVLTYTFQEFIPLLDEDDGTIKAGVRWWKLADDRPLRYTLYEMDGFTKYVHNPEKEPTVLENKRAYKYSPPSAPDADDAVGENYPGFPIIPLYSMTGESTLYGNKNTIDALDLAVSGMVNNVTDEMIYWVLKGCGAYESDAEIEEFIEKLHMLKAVNIGEDQTAEPHSVEPPYQASSTAIERLERQLYQDYMALDVRQISGAAVTATQIKAAYEPLNAKAKMLETNLTSALKKVMELAGIDDTPAYKEAKIVNTGEEIQNIMQSVQLIGTKEATRQVCRLLGIGDRTKEIIEEREAEEEARIKTMLNQNGGNAE